MRRTAIMAVMLSAAVAGGSAVLPAQAGTAAPAVPVVHPAARAMVGARAEVALRRGQAFWSGPAAGSPALRGLAERRALALTLARSGHRGNLAEALRSAVAARPWNGRHAGVITGVARDAGGRPIAGACVTATGPAGAVTAMSRADGRYLLSGLVPGRDALSIRSCPGQGPRTSLAGGALWPGLPAQVLVGAGQAQTMPPVTLLPASQFASYPAGPRPAAQVSQTGRTGTGGISGTVTGGGHPLTGICASADRVGGGSGRSAATSTTGRYHIAGLAPGRYQVQFSAGVFCGNSGNWLSQWYRGITTPFPPPKAVKIQVRAGKIRTGIDAAMKLGGEIRGTIRTRSGTPLPRICVTAFGRVPGGFVGMLLRSGPGGRYALHGLFPGRYTIEFSVGCGNKGNFAPQWWRGQTSAGRATPIAIKGTKIVSHVDAALDLAR